MGVSAVFVCLSALPVLSLILDRASDAPGATLPEFTALLEDELSGPIAASATDDAGSATTDLGGGGEGEGEGGGGGGGGGGAPSTAVDDKVRSPRKSPGQNRSPREDGRERAQSDSIHLDACCFPCIALCKAMYVGICINQWPCIGRQTKVWSFSISILLSYAVITWCRSETVPGLGFAQVHQAQLFLCRGWPRPVQSTSQTPTSNPLLTHAKFTRHPLPL